MTYSSNLFYFYCRFGRQFELPLLAQSFIMIAAMLMMLQLCTKIRRESDMSAKKRSFLGEHIVNFQTNYILCLQELKNM